MKYKTADLEGDLLDAATAKANGMHPYYGRSPRGLEPPSPEVWRDAVGWPVPKFSTSWSDGGPIIGRERIGVEWDHYNCFGTGWCAVLEHDARSDGGQRSFGSGPTPLIAAMRAYISSKFGSEVELP